MLNKVTSEEYVLNPQGILHLQRSLKWPLLELLLDNLGQRQYISAQAKGGFQ